MRLLLDWLLAVSVHMFPLAATALGLRLMAWREGTSSRRIADVRGWLCRLVALLCALHRAASSPSGGGAGEGKRDPHHPHHLHHSHHKSAAGASGGAAGGGTSAAAGATGAGDAATGGSAAAGARGSTIASVKLSAEVSCSWISWLSQVLVSMSRQMRARWNRLGTKRILFRMLTLMIGARASSALLSVRALSTRPLLPSK
jgi:hypothetical protein